MADGDSKRRLIGVYMTEKEKEFVYKQAKSLGITPSRYCRELIIEDIKTQGILNGGTQ